MVLQWFVDIFNVVIEVWLGYWLFNVPEHRRFKHRWVRVVEYIAFFGLTGGSILLNRMVGIRFSNGLLVILVAFFTLLTVSFTKMSVAYCLAWSGIYWITIGLLELPGIVFSGWMIGQPYVNCIWQPIAYDYIYLFIYSVALIALYKKWGSVIRSYIPVIVIRKNTFMWFGFAIIEWWAITYFLIVGHTQSGRDVFIYNIISILLILFLLMAFSIFVIYRRTEALRQQKVLEEERVDIEYKKIKAEYQQKSRELHDMKHRLRPIESYLSQGDSNRALVYVRELLGEISESQERIHGWTGNLLLDSLLDSKAETARCLGIDFSIDVATVGIDFSDRDMSVLFGNLLDNAIEAARQCSADRWIYVQIVTKGNMFLIRVRNAFENPPVEKDGRLLSTKAEKEGHGWGLESVRSIVKKNGGELEIKYDKKYFEITIFFLEKCKEGYHGKGD